ncbi:hypothetical protein BLJAPNOD_05181 [Ensifer sp. M14]|uniref:tripartite tricarboxylate transporter TctB family protein n=1 Tax=Ensifer sp. M14 TaxID=2203782 RepID=UPI000E1D2AEE|nr:tripartite tricarboxylate transporter TctB family protein [Ensifer sp. M14]RDL47955.1 hypothetical protein BLJAPNOD_05181 [Ensifer sp. M14]
MRISDLLSGAIFIAFGITVLLQANSLPSIGGGVLSAGFFPGLLGVGLALGGVIVAGKALVQGATLPLVRAEPWMRDFRKLAVVALISISIPFFAFAAPAMGTIATSFIILTVMMLAQGQKMVSSIVIAVIVSLAIHLLFSEGMGVPMPVGIIEGMLS